MGIACPNLQIFTFGSRKDPSTRYRVYQYLPYLKAKGYHIEVKEPGKKIRWGLKHILLTDREEVQFLKVASRGDILFIQRRLFSLGFLEKLKKLNKKIIFDFDDSIFTSPDGDWSFLTRRRILARLKRTLKIADQVWVGNSYLKGVAEAYRSRQVQILPTVIDLGRYPIKSHRQVPKITLGWIGTSSNHRYLSLLREILPALAREGVPLKFLVVSDRDFHLAGVEVENRRWSEANEIQDLLDMDIGLMPLEDNEWTRGKCSLKALQYLACGIPAVCSDVGANREVVEDGVNGFLPKNPGAWLAALRILAASPEKRTALGLAGRQGVEENYNLKKTADLLIRTLGQSS